MSPFTLTLLAIASLTHADEMAWSEVGDDGNYVIKFLDVPVSSAKGAENLYIENPMDAHDWIHTDIVTKSLQHWRYYGPEEKLKKWEDELRPIFTALPKEADGTLGNETTRYALHRLFTQKHGWTIKGLEPSGGAWMATQTVTPDVKDVNKYMVPSYLQQLFSYYLGHGYDLRNLAILAAVLDHMIHSEMLAIMHSIYKTLELSTAGKKSEKAVNDIIDTFLMVFAFGINMEVSSLKDVQNTKAHLDTTHAGWPQLQALAKEVQKGASMGTELNFDEMVGLVEKIAQGYSSFQAKDCRRAKDELSAKPSYLDGRVAFSEVQASHATGRRTLLTEDYAGMEKLGVLAFGKNADGGLLLHGANKDAQLIIPNYLQSQSMCLSTASMYTVCCPNEGDVLLSRLEREVAAPTAAPEQLKRLVATLPGPGIADALLQDLHKVTTSTGDVDLHGRAFAGWMNRAFPLECAAPHEQQQTNPKTPDEWLGRSGAEVRVLNEMMSETADVLWRYTSMGKKDKHKPVIATDEPVSDPSVDVVAGVIAAFTPPQKPQSGFVSTLFRFTAMVSMVGLVAIAGKSALKATDSHPKKDKVECDWA